ncbi:hypothetical protein KJ865_01965 [Myxococcota bacterium]|nr:hypothetical protein [Myxococcota bacterium]
MKCILLKYMYSNEKPKLIGVFSSLEQAREAMAQLAPKPGFREASGILEEGAGRAGFRLREFVIDELAFKIVTPKSLIKKNQQVFLLEHQFTDVNAELVYHAIGVFSNAKEAKQMAVKLKNRPEYTRASEILDPSTIGNGFRISPLSLDTVDWAEGFQIPYKD